MTLVPVSHLHFCCQWSHSAHQHIPEKRMFSDSKMPTERCCSRRLLLHFGGNLNWNYCNEFFTFSSTSTWSGIAFSFFYPWISLLNFSVGTLRIDIHRYPALVFHFSMLVRCRLVFKYSSNLRSCSAAGFALICGRSGCGGTQPRDMTSTGTCFSLRAVWAHIGLLNRDATAGVRIFRVQVHEQHRVKMCQM